VHTQAPENYDALVDWDLKDLAGQAIQPGIYYWRLNQEPWNPILITP
jgi:hypothetical protein